MTEDDVQRCVDLLFGDPSQEVAVKLSSGAIAEISNARIPGMSSGSLVAKVTSQAAPTPQDVSDVNCLLGLIAEMAGKGVAFMEVARTNEEVSRRIRSHVGGGQG